MEIRVIPPRRPRPPSCPRNRPRFEEEDEEEEEEEEEDGDDEDAETTASKRLLLGGSDGLLQRFHIRCIR